jgi:AmiR/NasT family two-component response regulator
MLFLSSKWTPALSKKCRSHFFVATVGGGVHIGCTFYFGGRMAFKGNGNGHAIVLMEDDSQRATITAMLAALKYKTTDCQTVESFGQLPASIFQRLTLVVVDMVSEDGLAELFTAMAGRVVSAPVLISAADPPSVTKPQDMPLLAGYIPYPLSAEQFSAIVQQELRHFHERRACQEELASLRLVNRAVSILQARHGVTAPTYEAAQKLLAEIAASRNESIGVRAQKIIAADEEMHPHISPRRTSPSK